jgi:lactate dehydrogenase-like 2-hydroxyacid dehydrogenase
MGLRRSASSQLVVGGWLVVIWGGMPDTRPIVLVTEPEYRKGEDRFVAATDLDCRRSPDDEQQLASAVRDSQARFVILGNRQYVGPLYDALPAGGVIARFGVGHDGVDKQLATARQLHCTNTPGVLDQSVAEHAMLLIAAASRRFTSALASMTNGTWTSPAGQDLQGKRLAVIGCGGIGRAVARIASLGYGMRVAGCTRPGAAGPAALDNFERVTNDFAAAVRDADFVSLHMPARPDTVRFLNRERLALMNPRAWLVNTARGAVVDEAALFEALAAGRIAGAAIDVYTKEPYVPVDGSDLRSLPNVILTPHVGSNTVESNRRMAERALQNVRFAAAGDVARMDLLNRQL